MESDVILTKIGSKVQIGRRLRVRAWVVAVAWLALALGQAAAQTNEQETFSFIVAGDMRKFTGPAPAGQRFFDGACEAMKSLGAGAFMISPGDIDPPAPVRATLDRYLGTNYIWYPVVGNHDAEQPRNMAWLRNWAKAGIPHLVRRGPPGAEETCYSFDFGNSHFVVLNDYYDGHVDAVPNGDVSDAALAWLEKDLTATGKPLIWVTGHKPIESVPDMDTGRRRHESESVSRNTIHLKRFLELLKEHHVRAYLCGHTHDSSVAKVKGVWQADSGHARGAGDKGAPSTFLKVRISSERAWVDVYRADANGENYRLRKTVELD